MLSLFSAVLAAAAMAGATDKPVATPAAVTQKVIATNLQVPWGVAFLPNGNALVSERTTGDIVRIPKNGGAAKVVQHIADATGGPGDEGGTLGLALSPHYKRDKLIYLYYSTDQDNRVVRFKLGQTPKPILTGLGRAGNHNGGRLAFGPKDGKLYVSVGENGNTALAQDTTKLNGKILRINPNGSVPKDNPFHNAVWSYGHRNPQGLVFDKKGRLWASEFGQNTTDEVNLIKKGHNYGWPNVEGKGDTDGGKYTNPKVTWTPTSTASPSGVAIVGKNLYVGALQGHGVFRIPMNGTTLGTPTLLYKDQFGRIRTVIKAPGGGLWITTSNRDGRGSPAADDDKIIRIPAS